MNSVIVCPSPGGHFNIMDSHPNLRYTLSYTGPYAAATFNRNRLFKHSAERRPPLWWRVPAYCGESGWRR
jgi:hypothetical protein